MARSGGGLAGPRSLGRGGVGAGGKGLPGGCNTRIGMRIMPSIWGYALWSGAAGVAIRIAGFSWNPGGVPDRGPDGGPHRGSMVAAMFINRMAIDAVLASVSDRGRTRAGRVRYWRWAAAEPVLSGWECLEQMVVAARAAQPGVQDVLVGALLEVGAGDGLAQLAVVAVLSRGLGSVVAGWSRAGVPPGQLEEMEADLVSGCWLAAADLAGRVAAGEPVPARVGLRLLDRARQPVRAERRRQLRTALRLVPLSSAGQVAAGQDRPVDVALAGEIAGAVRARRITAAEAAPVFLTRVAGFDVAETARRLGTTPGSVRAGRSRTERRLAAA